MFGTLLDIVSNNNKKPNGSVSAFDNIVNMIEDSEYLQLILDILASIGFISIPFLLAIIILTVKNKKNKNELNEEKNQNNNITSDE